MTLSNGKLELKSRTSGKHVPVSSHRTVCRYGAGESQRLQVGVQWNLTGRQVRYFIFSVILCSSEAVSVNRLWTAAMQIKALCSCLYLHGMPFISEDGAFNVKIQPSFHF